MEEDSHFPFVETISVFATSNNIFSLMVKCLLDFGALGVEEPWRKFVSMGIMVIPSSKSIEQVWWRK